MRPWFALAVPLAPILAIGACVGDDPGSGPAPGADAASDAPAAPDTSSSEDAGDAGADAAPCNLAEPFGVPELVPGASTAASEGIARATANGLALYLSRVDDAGIEDLVRAERSSPTGAFAPASPLFPALDAGRRTSPTITADSKTLYYDDTEPDGGTRIHVSQRNSDLEAFAPGGTWAAPSINTLEYSPYVVPDGSAIYLITAAPGGQFRVYRVKRTANGLSAPELQFDPFPAPSSLGAPVVTADELTLYVALGFATSTSVDIYRARRLSKNDLFGAPELVAQVNDPNATDFPAWVSADHCTLLLVSNRANGAGGTDVWEAKRPK